MPDDALVGIARNTRRPWVAPTARWLIADGWWRAGYRAVWVLIALLVIWPTLMLMGDPAGEPPDDDPHGGMR